MERVGAYTRPLLGRQRGRKRRFPRSTRNSGTRTHSHVPPPSAELQPRQRQPPLTVRQHAAGRREGRRDLFKCNTLKKLRKNLKKNNKKLAFKREELTLRAGGGWRHDGAVDMDKVINCLFAAITLLLSTRGEVFKGKRGRPGGVRTERSGLMRSGGQPRRHFNSVWASFSLV